MQAMHNNNGEDAVTIVGALKRLGSQAPARQTFAQAVNRGKILKLADKTGPNGEALFSWASVELYVANGGFRPRKQPASGTDLEIETRSAIEPGSPDSQGTRVPEGPIAPKPAKSEPPKFNQGTNGVDNENRVTQRPPAKHHPLQKSGRERKPTPQRERSKPKVNDTSQGGEDSKGRRNPPLRAIKNTLRHLNFEETKAIRDWADNRLLTVLRPAPPVADCQTAAVEPIKQPNI